MNIETNGLRSMTSGELQHRIAGREDIAGITAIMNAAIAELQKPFLEEAQIQSSRAIMGLDTQLIDDGTYFVVTCVASWRDVGAGAGAPRCTVVISPPDATRPCLILRRMRRVSEQCIRILILSDAELDG